MNGKCDRRRNPPLVRHPTYQPHCSLKSMRGACTAWTPWLLRPSTGQSLREGYSPRLADTCNKLAFLRKLFRFLSFLHTAVSTADSIRQAAYQMGQWTSSERTKPGARGVDPPKPDIQVVGPPILDVRVFDPPTHPPTGLALIAHGRNATLDCPVVGTLARYLRERHGCRTVTWSARGVGNSEGTKGPDSENRKDYDVSLVYVRAHTRESELSDITWF